jgi:hypothetical protein
VAQTKRPMTSPDGFLIESARIPDEGALHTFFITKVQQQDHLSKLTPDATKPQLPERLQRVFHRLRKLR